LNSRNLPGHSQNALEKATSRVKIGTLHRRDQGKGVKPITLSDEEAASTNSLKWEKGKRSKNGGKNRVASGWETLGYIFRAA